VDEPGALRAVDAFHEQRTFAGHAFVERQLQCCLHAFDDLEGGEQAARLLCRLGLLLFQPGQCSLRLGNGEVTRAAHGGLGGQQLAHIGQACGQRVGAFHQFVDQTCLQRGLGLEGLAGEHEGGGRLHAHQARGALGAARAGQQAQVHLGQAQRGGGQGQPVVGRQSHLQPTAQGRAVQHGDRGLVQVFDGAADLGQDRGHRGLAEFADVRPGNEGLAGAHQQHGGHCGVGMRLLHGGQKALAHGGAQGVDGRVVDGDDQNIAMQRGRNNGRCGSGGVHTGKSPGQWLCLLMTGGLLMREVILTITEPIDRLSKSF